VTIPSLPGGYRYAGFWWRFLAYLVDWLVLGIGGALAGAFLGLALGALGAGKVGIDWTMTIVSTIGYWLYFAILESSALQATLGKQACGLVVTDSQRRRISFARATGRYFAQILCVLTLGIGFLMAGWTQRKQGLHDFVCNTLVLIKPTEEARMTLPA
jgi:uncharacterized RDD family membrane protein YckC